MIHNNDGLNSLNENDDIISSQDTNEIKNSKGEVKIGNTTFTEEEIERANMPQPNVIANKADGHADIANSYRDKQRVASRANEASDSTDTNTGGIVAGAAKGTSQS